MSHKALLVIILSLIASGCATYTTPGAGVSLAGISDASIEEAFTREPAATFPARLAVARVQAAGYRSASNRGYGDGRFSVLTTRDIETSEDFDSLAAIDSIAAVAPLTRLIVPTDLASTRDLRVAAAQLKADLLLIYTIDTAFGTEVGKVGPLQTVALGFLSNRQSHVDATTSAMVVDVRSGFVYGTAEFTATESERSNFWGTQTAIESARLAAETTSFQGATAELRKLLGAIVTEHAAGK